MKKVFIGLALVVSVAAFSSCKKQCKCTTYIGGIATATKIMESDEIQGECSDMSENLFGMEIKCK